MPASIDTHNSFHVTSYTAVQIRFGIKLSAILLFFCMESETDEYEEFEASLFSGANRCMCVCVSHMKRISVVKLSRISALILIIHWLCSLIVLFSCFYLVSWYFLQVFPWKKIFFLARRHSFFHSMVFFSFNCLWWCT